MSERERFESWFRSRQPRNAFRLETRSGDGYFDAVVQGLWEAWESGVNDRIATLEREKAEAVEAAFEKTRDIWIDGFRFGQGIGDGLMTAQNAWTDSRSYKEARAALTAKSPEPGGEEGS